MCRLKAKVLCPCSCVSDRRDPQAGGTPQAGRPVSTGRPPGLSGRRVSTGRSVGLSGRRDPQVGRPVSQAGRRVSQAGGTLANRFADGGRSAGTAEQRP